MPQSKKVVVVGGGFAGLSALDHLAGRGYDVTLVDRHPYTTFQPLLYQVATGGLNPGDITYALRRLVSRKQGVSFRQGVVTGIDQDAHEVTLDRGAPLPYDALLLTPGVGANFFGIPGAEENARTIYTRAEALAARDLVFAGLEKLATSGNPNARFTVVVVGGGATGVEMAGTLAEMKSEALPAIYPELSTDSLHVMLVEMTDQLLGPFEPRLRTYALHELRKRGVDVRLGTSVTEVGEHHIAFEDGVGSDCDVVIWASGVGGHAVVKDWGLPLGKGGRIVVEPNLRVQGTSDVYAAGDAAVLPDSPLPQLAQPALQTGRHAAEQIVAAFEGREERPFSYVNKGTMATIGRNSAVCQLPGKVRLTGFPAWALWVVVHLATLLGGRNRVQTMINMAFRYFAWPSSAATIVGDIAGPDDQQDAELEQRTDPEGAEPGEPALSKVEPHRA